MIQRKVQNLILKTEGTKEGPHMIQITGYIIPPSEKASMEKEAPQGLNPGGEKIWIFKLSCAILRNVFHHQKGANAGPTDIAKDSVPQVRIMKAGSSPDRGYPIRERSQ